MSDRIKYTVHLTSDAFSRFRAADAEFIGTPDYCGLAYFWAYEYRYPMRDANSWDRVRVHQRMLDAGLDVQDEGPEHAAIIAEVTGTHLIATDYA